MAASTVSSKGQVTIPVSIRNRMGILEGDRVEFINEGGKVVLRKVPNADNPFQKQVGALAGQFSSKTQILDWVSSLRDAEPE